jgi:protein tyrosine/serine phosphatase
MAVSISVAPVFAEDQSRVLPNFQKVNDHVYRGGQPSNEGFRTLAKLGVKTIVDLREIGEHSQAEEARIVKAEGMQYVSVPMKGMSAPSEEQMSRVLALLNDESGGPVFIHCRRGADRTGTVIAAYRIGHDHWENKNALNEAKGLGMGFWEKAMQHYVLHYAATAPAPSVAGSADASRTPVGVSQ